MLSKKKSQTISVDTLIGKNAFFEGNLKLEGTIRIDGKVNGEIEVKGDVVIGETALVTGNIVSTNVIISGTVEGNVIAKEQLRLTSSSKLVGDIKMNSLIADEGAILNGNCGMLDNTKKIDPPLKTKDKQN
ncbi:MAG: polymer-forming cytoskeletal protein [Firmicutes bacterium]|nr:polymer-forming cytoskeletal protein [Bacillota bacterium]